MNLVLDRETNPDYFEIVEKRFTKLMDQWNSINKKIHDAKIPIVVPFRVKGELDEIQKELKALQAAFLEWNQKAGDLLVEPKYGYKKDDNIIAIMVHYSGILKHRISTMNHDMLLIANNYNNKIDQYKSQINFIIAITSFVLTFMGLIIALYTIF
ncbi:MAG: hypothetical protein JJ892_15245 [Balneola sp.]|nr:hypothetical protein [Balneola sp.]